MKKRDEGDEEDEGVYRECVKGVIDWVRKNTRSKLQE